MYIKHKTMIITSILLCLKPFTSYKNGNLFTDFFQFLLLARYVPNVAKRSI